MITHQQIIRKADDDGVSSLVVERDYVLSHCLVAVSAMSGVGRLVFKGGTALRMCYLKDYRYSADLDFSLVEDFPEADALQAMNATLESAGRDIGFPTLKIVSDAGNKIEYEGPLGRPRRIKLDLDDGELVLSSVNRHVLRRYSDLPDSGPLPTYALTEIAAEKLRCVIQRLQCRDFYDLHQLLEEQRVDIDAVWEMFVPKARHKNIDPDTFHDRFEARLPQYEERWLDEMSEHVPGELRHFDAMVRELKRRLRSRRR